MSSGAVSKSRRWATLVGVSRSSLVRGGSLGGVLVYWPAGSGHEVVVELLIASEERYGVMAPSGQPNTHQQV